MPKDDLDHIPSIVPTRDNAPRPTGGGATAKGRKPRGAASRSTPTNTGGSGLLARLFLTLSLAAAAVACAWAWQLQLQLDQAGMELEPYAGRIGDLEARLSDTDEGMNQNAELQAAKIRELDSEVRKLWDNVWKQASERLAKLENSSSAQGKKLDTTASNLATAQGQIKAASGDIAKLNSVAGDLERIIASGKVNQAEVERVADSINQVNLEIAKLNKRVQGNEEWINSINAFRKQVNASLVELQAALRSQPKTTP